MLFAPLASLLALAFAGVVVSQDDATAGQPACFLQCAQSTSMALGCTGATDFPCYCTKQQFIIDNAKCTLQSCPDLAMNSTVVTTSFAQLEAVCTAATGSFNLTVPSAAELGVTEGTMSSSSTIARATNTPATVSTTRVSSVVATSKPSNTAAASTITSHHNGASSFSVTPFAMGLSLLAAGFAALA